MRYVMLGSERREAAVSLNGCDETGVQIPGNRIRALYEVQMAMIAVRIAPDQSRDLTLLIVRM